MFKPWLFHLSPVCIQQVITSLGFRIPILKVETIVLCKTVVEMKCQNLCKVFSLSFGGIINAQYMLVTFTIIIVTIKVKIIGRKWEPV